MLNTCGWLRSSVARAFNADPLDATVTECRRIAANQKLDPPPFAIGKGDDRYLSGVLGPPQKSLAWEGTPRPDGLLDRLLSCRGYGCGAGGEVCGAGA